MVNRSEVWWYEPPDHKRRPALVMTRQEAIGRLNALFVVLATTNIRNLDTEIELGPQDGMPQSCVLNADQIAAVGKVFLMKRITTLGAEKMSEVCQALARATAC